MVTLWWSNVYATLVITYDEVTLFTLHILTIVIDGDVAFTQINDVYLQFIPFDDFAWPVVSYNRQRYFENG